MSLIRCKIGYAETYILGTTYVFAADAAGRFVCDVPVDRHVELLLSAGTYEQVDRIPVATLLEQEAAAVQLIRDRLAAATTPALANIAEEGQPPVIVVRDPWPELVAWDLAQMIEDGVPDFITIDPNDKMIVTVSNGRAEYRSEGAADGIRLYQLLEGATFEPATGSESPVDEDEVAAAEGVRPEDEPEATEATDAPAPDDLTKISGIGPATSAKLAAAGVTSYAQIAAWTAADVDRLDAELALRGAITRDNWIEQASGLVSAAG